MFNIRSFNRMSFDQMNEMMGKRVKAPVNRLKSNRAINEKENLSCRRTIAGC